MFNPLNQDEFEKAVESGVSQVSGAVKKSVGQTVKSTTKQVGFTEQDFVNALYAPTEKPAGENGPSEAGIEQVQGGGQQQQAQAPKSHAENTGGLADQIPFIPNAGEKVDYRPTLDSIGDVIPIIPGQGAEGKTSSFMEQVTGQASSEKSTMGGMDPTKQMTVQEQETFTEQQKKNRENERQHHDYARQFDPIGNLETQVAKLRQKRDQEEKERAEQEEREREEKKQREAEAAQQLAQPSTKGKAGSPPQKQTAVDMERTKTESNRGAKG